ncbi:hypothetical protein CCR95_21515 [Thiocystis minor]|uniref:DUF2288 domain-containing protein n=1 Tax=Thiocystis minor TaxID=61597 RepID=UPI001912C01B|nr:DUF2288 domain-containing protein [Thiocystis minor]MBK5966581.1 hypothetical protein [Thiocystis minor]
MRPIEDRRIGSATAVIDPAGDARRTLNQETARIPWRDLQRFFAQGKVIWVRDGLDLIETALLIARDDAPTIDAEMARGGIVPVPDRQARDWFETDASLWAVVVKPWVLVQEAACTSGSTPTPAQGSSRTFCFAPPNGLASE